MLKRQTEIEKLEKDKLKHVQMLASHYQRIEGLPKGPQRDSVVKDILECKQKIFEINERLVELKGDEFGPFY